MKKNYLLYVFAVSIFWSCKPTNIKPVALVSLNVINAVVNGETLTLNTAVATVPNNGFLNCTLFAGQSKVDLYPAATPTTPYYNKIITTANGEYYSLFLAGSS